MSRPVPSLPNAAAALAAASATTSGFGGTGPATFAILGTSEADSAVRCVACAHRCLIRSGRAGICRVRENRDGKLVSLVYGQAVAANADPIEKKPLFHAYPGSVAFSIATRGCNFHCANCQNWAISQAARDGLAAPAFDLPPRDVVAAALASGSRSIAYTYTEPTVFIEYAVDTARLAREVGLANLLVTNGYETPEALDLFGPVIDAANVDLKAFDDRFYRKVVGARLAPVLDALVGMRERGIWVEVTTLLIPGLNDGPRQLLALARWIAAELGPETPWHVSRFFPTYRLTDLDPTPVATVRRAVELGREAGLRHVYSGNLASGDEDTRCAGCDETLIRRHGYRATRSASLVEGRCARCGHTLAGIGLSESGLSRGPVVSGTGATT
ncbi:MAG TPA: AmmeMemoRadiSam system radical SAM enzyme [Candidatus Limnocylindrales bacterium]